MINVGASTASASPGGGSVPSPGSGLTLESVTNQIIEGDSFNFREPILLGDPDTDPYVAPWAEDGDPDLTYNPSTGEFTIQRGGLYYMSFACDVAQQLGGPEYVNPTLRQRSDEGGWYLVENTDTTFTQQNQAEGDCSFSYQLPPILMRPGTYAWELAIAVFDVEALVTNTTTITYARLEMLKA